MDRVASKNQLMKEFDWFLENHDALVEQYDGKYLVIKNHKVIGTYASSKEAILETSKTEPNGTFLVQYCSPDESSYTVTIHSRIRVQ